MPGIALALLGPTASGKSRLAMQLAERLPVEIVSVDSALVYRGLDIGTAKPSAEERRLVPHHLVDLVDPDQPYSAGQWRADAIRKTLEVLERGKTPLLVGGTMLYFRALVAGLDQLPQADPEVRRQIDLQAAQAGWPALHAELQKVDPEAAQRIGPTDSQRIQRALEVWRLTGTPLTRLQTGTRPELPFGLRAFALFPSDRVLLKEKIARRFDAMLRDGLVEEVAGLRKRFNLSPAMPSMRAVGYRQVWEFLDGGSSAAQMREQAINATRQLAKRQLTWLRSFPDLFRLDPGSGEDAPVALQLLLDQLS